MEEEDGDTIASYSIENLLKKNGEESICRDDNNVNLMRSYFGLLVFK